MAIEGTTRAWTKLAKEFKSYHEELHSVCWLCRQPINYQAPGHHPDSFEADHFLPRNDYPELALEWDNLRPSHCSCNRSRGKRDARAPIGPQTRTW